MSYKTEVLTSSKKAINKLATAKLASESSDYQSKT